MAAIPEAEFQRQVLRRLLAVNRELLDLNERSIDMSAELDTLKASMAALGAAAEEAKADSARHAARTNEAVGLLQALTQRITDMAQNAGGASQADLTELNASATAALAKFNEANTQRDAADTTLADGVQANTPAP